MNLRASKVIAQHEASFSHARYERLRKFTTICMQQLSPQHRSRIGACTARPLTSGAAIWMPGRKKRRTPRRHIGVRVGVLGEWCCLAACVPPRRRLTWCFAREVSLSSTLSAAVRGTLETLIVRLSPHLSGGFSAPTPTTVLLLAGELSKAKSHMCARAVLNRRVPWSDAACVRSGYDRWRAQLAGFLQPHGMERSGKSWKALESSVCTGRCGCWSVTQPHVRLHDSNPRQRWPQLILMHDAVLRGCYLTDTCMLQQLRTHVSNEGAGRGSRSTSRSANRWHTVTVGSPRVMMLAPVEVDARSNRRQFARYYACTTRPIAPAGIYNVSKAYRQSSPCCQCRRVTASAHR